MSGRVVVAVFLGIVGSVVGAALGLVWLAGYGVFGRLEGAGSVQGTRRLPARVAAEDRRIEAAAEAIGAARPKRVLFGDLHVHSTFSLDAFLLNLPGMLGEGAHPPADACDFARHCSALDFFALTDSTEGLSVRQWRETQRVLRDCEAVAQEASPGEGGAHPADPVTDAGADLVPFLGFEWSRTGATPATHQGSWNLLLAELAEGEVPPRPIAPRAPGRVARPSPMSRGLLAFRSRHPRFHDLAALWTEQEQIPVCGGAATGEPAADCIEVQERVGGVFASLTRSGIPFLAVAHGTARGAVAPPGVEAADLLRDAGPLPGNRLLIEVDSGFGASEVTRRWRAVRLGEDGARRCPEPRRSYLPMCWRAGEIAARRCRAQGGSPTQCARRGAAVRAEAALTRAERSLAGVSAEEWLDAGECRDCDQPVFQYRPGVSAQALLARGPVAGAPAASRSSGAPGEAGSFRPGFIASSGNHSARPGTGYKEIGRPGMTDSVLPEEGPASRLFPAEPPADPATRGRRTPIEAWGTAFRPTQWLREAATLRTGGLVAVHATARSREAIWEALERREVYGTSGPRILLWFDLLNPPGGGGRAAPMGSDLVLAASPVFEVRAVGSRVQQPGCPRSAVEGLGAERLAWLCRGECHHPGTRRRLVTRIEVVRIRPARDPSEPIETRVEDPWQSFSCPADPVGCRVRFEDAGFVKEGRETFYYVRAYEEPVPTINAAGIRCRADESGLCREVQLCGGGGPGDECLAPAEPRAWSSPIRLRPARGSSPVPGRGANARSLRQGGAPTAQLW